MTGPTSAALVTRTRVGAFVVCGAILVAGCSSAPSAGSASVAPTAIPGQTQHVIAGPLALDAPVSWHVRSALPNPTGNVSFAYLSPQALSSDCEISAQGGVCHPWPVAHLDPGGIVVAVRLHGMPGSMPPVGGEPITVAGLPATRISGSAEVGCRAIGGAAVTDIVLPQVEGASGWVSLDACLAGPDKAAADTAFSAIVESVTIAGDGASPQVGSRASAARSRDPA